MCTFYKARTFSEMYTSTVLILLNPICYFDILFIVVFPHLSVTRMFSHPFPHLDAVALPFSQGFIFLIDTLIFASQQSFVSHFDQLSLLFNHAIIDAVINVHVKKLMVRTWLENLIWKITEKIKKVKKLLNALD